MSNSSATTPSGELFGYLARFENPSELLAGIEDLREAGYTSIDPHTPFPVHGIDDAMGEGRSILPGFVLVGGLTGTATAVALCGWTSAVDYPIITAGKPFFSIEAFVPIMFELTILFASFTTLFGMLILNRLPKLYSPLFKSANFLKRGSDDGFFIVVGAEDPLFDVHRTGALLAEIGGLDIEILEA